MKTNLSRAFIPLFVAVSLAGCTAAPLSSSVSDAAGAPAATEVAATSETVMTSETAVSETAVSETAVSETTVSETAVSETTVNETTVSETTVSETTSSPETAADAELRADATTIALGEETAITGAGAEISDGGVTITQAGTYVLSGTLDDGMVEVNAPDASVTLVLNGVSITNSDGPAILFSSSSESIVTTVKGSSNVLADGGANDELDAALFSRASLTIDGEGDLVITGNNQEGIASQLHLNIAGGNIWVTSVDDGLNANNDGVSVITISGGYLFVDAGGDGIDSNGAINFSGGTTVAMSALTDASGGIDADGDVTISGGTMIATGARNSGPIAASTQKSVGVTYSSTQAAGTLAAIVDPDGLPLLVIAPSVPYQQLVFSSAEIAEGVTYLVYSGGEATGTVQDGVYLNGSYTPGTEVTTVTTESVNSIRGPGGSPQP